MGLDLIPKALRQKYHFDERHHACAILARDFPNEFADLLACLDQFRLRKTHILTRGGGLSPIPAAIDGFLRQRGWNEKSFDIKIVVDGSPIPTPTHKIDNFKNRSAITFDELRGIYCRSNYKERNRIRLEAANGEYDPIYVDPDEDVRVLGTLVGVVRKC